MLKSSLSSTLRDMLKSWTESEKGLYPLWIILSSGFETDMD